MVGGLDGVVELCQARTESAVYRAAARVAAQLVDADGAEYLREDEGRLVAAASYPATAPRRSYPLVTGLVGGAYSTGTACIVDDAQDTRSASAGAAADASRPTARSLCCVPVGGRGLLVARTEEPGQFDDVHRELLERLASWTLEVLERPRPAPSRVRTNGGRRNLNDPADRLEAVADVLSHDLVNHLNVAKGNLDLAMDTVDDRHVERAMAAVERIEELAAETVLLARSGELVDHTGPVDLRAAVGEAWAALPTGDASLEVESSATLVANRRSLRHLLENLLQNAVVHAGGPATVRAGATDDGFYVEDEGPGVPVADRERVFESGYGTGGGAGLGLTIAERIAAAHGWSMQVAEGRDGGARFEVSSVQFD